MMVQFFQIKRLEAFCRNNQTSDFYFHFLSGNTWGTLVWVSGARWCWSASSAAGCWSSAAPRGPGRTVSLPAPSSLVPSRPSASAGRPGRPRRLPEAADIRKRRHKQETLSWPSFSSLIRNKKEIKTPFAFIWSIVSLVSLQ